MILLSFFAGAFSYVSLFKRKLLLFFIILGTVGLLLGFGPRIGIRIGEHYISPYVFIHKIIPPLAGINAPARLGVFFVIAVSVLAATGFGHIRRIIKDRSMKIIFTSLIFLLLFFEMWMVPIGLSFPDNSIFPHKGAINWLKVNGGGRTVLDLPMSIGSKELELQPEVCAMLRMLEHKNPVVNGYAEYFPPSFRQLRDAVFQDFKGKGSRYIRAFGVSYILLDKAYMSGSRKNLLERIFAPEIVCEDERNVIYFLSKSKYIEMDKILPFAADFEYTPKEGQVVGIKLLEPVINAVLIEPQKAWWININWIDENKTRKTKRLRVHGSVIIDERSDRLYLRFSLFPKKDIPGEAILVSSEEVAALIARQSSMK